MWDSILLAYADREPVMPAAYRKIVMRNNGDVLPTLHWSTASSRVSGAPSRTASRRRAFHPLTGRDWSGLDAEGGGVAAAFPRRARVR
jgi:hypothetical protein